MFDVLALFFEQGQERESDYSDMIIYIKWRIDGLMWAIGFRWECSAFCHYFSRRGRNWNQIDQIWQFLLNGELMVSYGRQVSGGSARRFVVICLEGAGANKLIRFAGQNVFAGLVSRD